MRTPLALALLCACGTARASSPSGRPPKDAAQAYAKAGAVFTGTVVRVSTDAMGLASLADVDLELVLKGFDSLAPTVWVDGSGGPTYPARVFKPGQRLLFYVDFIDNIFKEPPGEVGLRADSVLHRVVPMEGSRAELVGLRGKARGWQEASGLFRVPRWEHCAADRDCATIPALCGNWAVMNLASVGIAEGYFRRRRAAMDCILLERPKPEPACRESRCVPRPEPGPQ